MYEGQILLLPIAHFLMISLPNSSSTPVLHCKHGAGSHYQKDMGRAPIPLIPQRYSDDTNLWLEALLYLCRNRLTGLFCYHAILALPPLVQFLLNLFLLYLFLPYSLPPPLIQFPLPSSASFLYLLCPRCFFICR
jgi:hypothetical protein